MCISQKVKGVLMRKIEINYFHKRKKILADCQICISVPLIEGNKKTVWKVRVKL